MALIRRDRIESAMEQLELSRLDVCLKLNVGLQAFQDWYDGKGGLPPEVLERLAALLRVEPADVGLH